MTEFDATQPVPEQADLNKDFGPSAGAALANSAMVPQGPGTGPMRPEAPSFTPPAGSVPAEDNTGKWSNIYKPGMTPQDFHTDLGSTTSKLIQAGVDPMTALLAGGLHALDAMRDVAKEKPPQEDAGQRAGGIVDRFFAPLKGASGGIGGAGNVAAARIAQTNADQKKKLDEFNEQHKQKMEDIKEGVNLAISNAQMLHSQFLLHKEQGEEQDKNIADGKEAVKLLKSQPTAGVPVMEDVTADEIKRGIEQHTKDPNTGIDMTTMTPYATGKKEVGTDESGNPRYQATYTVMRVPPTTSITDPAMAKKLFPEAKGLDNISAETPLVVPTSLYNARFQSSETSAANKAVMAKQAAEAAKAQGEEAEAIEYSNFDGQTVWSRAQTDAYKNNPKATEPEIAMIAYRNLQKDNIDPATGKPKFPHLQADVRQAYGEKNWDTMQLVAQKAEESRALEAQKAQEKREASSYKELQESGNSQDAQALGQYMVEAQMDPSQLSKRAKNYNAAIIAANQYSMQKYGVPFNLAQASVDYKYANQKSTRDMLNFIDSVVDPNGSLDIAMAAGKYLPQMNEQTVNKVFNLTKGEFGDHRISDFQTAILGLADEYSKIMGQGTPSDTGRKQALDILQAGYSKGQLQGAADIIRKDIAARERGMIKDNRYLLQERGLLKPGATNANPSGIQPPPQTRPAGVPPAATQMYKDAQGNIVGYALNGQYVAIPQHAGGHK